MPSSAREYQGVPGGAAARLLRRNVSPEARARHIVCKGQGEVVGGSMTRYRKR